MLNQKITITTLLCIALYFVGCKAGGDFPGREYMPDMAHSKAYEIYVPSPTAQQADGSEAILFADGKAAREPVAGTIARGQVPYHYDNDNNGYEQAGRELRNPYNKVHDKVQKEGAAAYKINCAVCHGAKGKADGSIVKSGKYPPPPSYFRDDILALSEGKMFHSVHYGKNMMGSYSSQLSKEERWKVVSYIRDMQAAHIAADKGMDKKQALGLLLNGRGYNAAPAPKPTPAPVPVVSDDASASADAGTNAATGNANVAAAADAGKKPKVNPKANPKVNSKVKPKVNPKAKPKVNPKAKPKANKGVSNTKNANLDKLDKKALTKGKSLVLKNVLFKVSSAKLEKASSTELNKLVKVLKDNPSVKIELGGHTDNTGLKKTNQKLSTSRAKTVFDYLVKKGISSKRLKYKGYGSSKPRSKGTTPAAHAKNRRTEFTVP